MIFDKLNGVLKSYEYRGASYLHDQHGPQSSFWRGMTDNDFGNGFQNRAAFWKTAADSMKLMEFKSQNISKHEIKLTAKYQWAQDFGELEIDYVILGSGELYIQHHLKLNRSIDMPELPRLGMTMFLNPEFKQLQWYGRGPQENYWDRKSGYKVGTYESTTEQQLVPYIRPQENSNLTDVRWATLRNEQGEGLMIAGFPTIEFSAQNYVLEDFDQPDKNVNKHTSDIQKRDFISVDMDFSQTGVAGDDSWWSRAHPQYTLYPGDYCYAYRIRPLAADDLAQGQTSAYKIRPLIQSQFCEKPNDDFFKDKIRAQHKALGKKVEIKGNYSHWFSAGGTQALTDGFIGTQNYGDDHWMGFYDQDVEFIIDLGSIQMIELVQLHFLKDLRGHFYLPSSVEISVSRDGDSYEKLEVNMEENPEKKLEVCSLATISFDRKTRYIKINIQAFKPEGRDKGNAFMVDEIVVK